MGGPTGEREGRSAPVPRLLDRMLAWAAIGGEIVLLMFVGLSVFLGVAAAVVMPVAIVAAPLSPPASAILWVVALVAAGIVTAVVCLRLHRAIRRRIPEHWTIKEEEEEAPARPTKRSTESILEDVRRLDARFGPSGPVSPSTRGDPEERR